MSFSLGYSGIFISRSPLAFSGYVLDTIGINICQRWSFRLPQEKKAWKSHTGTLSDYACWKTRPAWCLRVCLRYSGFQRMSIFALKAAISRHGSSMFIHVWIFHGANFMAYWWWTNVHLCCFRRIILEYPGAKSGIAPFGNMISCSRNLKLR